MHLIAPLALILYVEFFRSTSSGRFSLASTLYENNDGIKTRQRAPIRTRIKLKYIWIGTFVLTIGNTPRGSFKGSGLAFRIGTKSRRQFRNYVARTGFHENGREALNRGRTRYRRQFVVFLFFSGNWPYLFWYRRDWIGSRMEQIRSAPIKTACGEVRTDLDKPARGMSGKVTALHALLNEMMVRDWKSNIFGLIPVFANNNSDRIKFFYKIF